MKKLTKLQHTILGGWFSKIRQVIVALWRLLRCRPELIHSPTLTLPEPSILTPIMGSSLPVALIYLPFHPTDSRTQINPVLPSYVQPSSKEASCSPSSSRRTPAVHLKEPQALSATSSYPRASDVPSHDPDTGGTTKALLSGTPPTEHCHLTEPLRTLLRCNTLANPPGTHTMSIA